MVAFMIKKNLPKVFNYYTFMLKKFFRYLKEIVGETKLREVHTVRIVISHNHRAWWWVNKGLDPLKNSCEERM